MPTPMTKGNERRSIALAIPVQPGQLEAWRAFVAELHGPRAAEYQAHLARRGIVSEQIFHQPTPQGDIVILVVTAEDPALSMAVLAQPQEPFDRWFVEQLHAFHGITPEVLGQLRPGERVASWPPAAVGL